ncbi:MAG: GspE/PulE family protein [Phycisphaerales bacterium]
MINGSDYLLRSLVDEHLISTAQAEQVKRSSLERSVPVDEALVALGMVSPRDIGLVRATLLEVPFVDVPSYDVDIANARLLPRSVAEKHRAFPLFVQGAVVTVGMADPLNIKAIDQLRQLIKGEIEPVLCLPEALASLTAKAYSLSSGHDDPQAHADAVPADLTTGEEPIVAAVNQIINDATSSGASDIHISPCEHELQLRIRVDGQLVVRQGPPLSAHAGIVQRLKVMANLDLTQTRRPQDGKFRFTCRGETLDVRLSTIPTVCGENIVMRLLRPNGQILDYADLGMNEALVHGIEEVLEHPHGMLLVTGPTGSGKTSTLYTGLKKLNTPSVSIVTIEDPVEIRMHGVRQVQANAEIGFTFAAALRSILRQDPDIILLGEIRDAETALIATQASLTGHFVLSTLHTNDAAGAIARLKDLGVPGFVITSAVLGVIAQRLVRKVCRDCAEVASPDRVIRARFGVEATDDKFMRGAGCARCGGSGFRGRVGIYELLRVTPAVALEIERGANTGQLNSFAVRNGMVPMWRDGLDKARMGITSLEEVAQAVATFEMEEPVRLRMSA